MEIEIKARIDEKDAVMQRLAALGCEFSPMKTQDDMVWVRRGRGPVARPERDGARRGRAKSQQRFMRDEKMTMKEFLSSEAFLRIRIQNGDKVILTAKKSKTDLANGGASNLVKREHEVVVDSAEEARGILEMLGLKEVVRCVKRRQTTEYNGYEICIDEVEGLGSFIELEKMGEKEEAPQIQKEMVEFLATLGVPEANLVHKGYDILVLEKHLSHDV